MNYRDAKENMPVRILKKSRPYISLQSGGTLMTRILAIYFGLAVFCSLSIQGAHASCMTKPKADLQAATDQLKSNATSPSQYTFAKLLYVNSQYACHLISESKFCSQIETLAKQTIDQMMTDFADTPERKNACDQVANMLGEVRTNCTGNPGWGALATLDCLPKLITPKN
jgi:hypothetical protein